jgi:hypothetical protein
MTGYRDVTGTFPAMYDQKIFRSFKGVSKGVSPLASYSEITSDFKKIYISLLLAPTNEPLN